MVYHAYLDLTNLANVPGEISWTHSTPYSYLFPSSYPEYHMVFNNMFSKSRNVVNNASPFCRVISPEFNSMVSCKVRYLREWPCVQCCLGVLWWWLKTGFRSGYLVVDSSPQKLLRRQIDLVLAVSLKTIENNIAPNVTCPESGVDWASVYMRINDTYASWQLNQLLFGLRTTRPVINCWHCKTVKTGIVWSNMCLTDSADCQLRDQVYCLCPT